MKFLVPLRPFLVRNFPVFIGVIFRVSSAVLLLSCWWKIIIYHRYRMLLLKMPAWSWLYLSHIATS